MCLSLTNTHTNRCKSVYIFLALTNARKDLAQEFGTEDWSNYTKLILLD